MNPALKPCASKQFRTVPLVITPCIDGYRLAFAAGEIFEPIAKFKTMEEAAAAYRQARKALSCP